jgi:glutathione-regulated potassium-efflux system ancillary protein KefG
MRDGLAGVAGLVVRDLYELYPDFYVDVELEQQLLRQADLIIFQHPIYWYSAPALLKQWLDAVLLPGFAFGTSERVLEGKSLISAVSTGHSARSYTLGGYDGWTIEEFLRPFEQTARHCGMNYLPPFVLYDAKKIDDEGLAGQAAEYRRVIEAHLDDLRRESGDGK